MSRYALHPLWFNLGNRSGIHAIGFLQFTRQNPGARLFTNRGARPNKRTYTACPNVTACLAVAVLRFLILFFFGYISQ